MKRAARAALAANTGIAENVGPSNDMFVADREGEVDGSSSAETTLSTGFAETGNENASKEVFLVLCRLIEACENRER